MNNPLSQAAIEWGHHVWLVYLALLIAGMLADVFLLVYYYAHPPHWDENAGLLRQKAAPAGFIVRLLLFLVSIFIVILSARKIAGAWGGPAVLENEPLWIIVQSVGFHGIGLLAIAGLLKQFGATWKGVFGLRSKRFFKALGTGLVFYLASMPFLWFYSLLYQAALKHIGYEPSWQEVALVLTGDQPLWIRIYFFFMGIVLAPVFEEVVFRGILLPYFAQKWGVSRSVILISLLFAGIHFHIPALGPLFVISLALSLAYISTRSILVPIAMHGIFNAVNLTLMLVMRN
ncbi:MAG TPA: hypothetical protein DCZ95_16350 [Verrucomicrobia bacterium]|nr:MAG: hypothetical protein A2X46_15805 [Lentisphaerae bacterium GWF2_57_35]HBA85653.1 hypothetical protein [Verrucomicrobiota bacterium]